jgi:ribose transport system substrate-binding protein
MEVESYQGNPCRVTVTKELKRLVDGLVADGTVSSFEVSDSSNDVNQQINQIRVFIDKKCTIVTK